ncbi:helix-turn-helix domain-containing protein [Pararhizobium sp. BT-229]|uniref:helix-turn-helix domain-containing protein n=1 Tax=Pararhizobium sp. BT-229 TaxID=2986923 RepID=UPI0021F7A431|nr:helix-turn-helix domain-containing protein [Pararhizobium sp. BT-229]MCV9960762.1 helix-turn-helix domain-containing protein [Pararhizobium sp. BT-229]
MNLKPVTFSKPRGHEPRISAPYVPGKRDKRFWTDDEDAIIREYFPAGGAAGCLARLEAHRTPTGVYQRAKNLGVTSSASSPHKGRYQATQEMDERIRKEWEQLDGKKKGEVRDLADRLSVPRWWLSDRLQALGLTIRHKKEPPWTAAEDELMKKAPLHQPDKAAKMFREHGFTRSPTAIVVRAKRLDLSRRAARKELSATQAAKILGIDSKSVTGRILSGELPAVKRDDQRRIQQGGSSWDIKPADLRQWILDNIDAIDLRKVDKVPFILLVAGEL